jgi:hypothetical protein
LAWSIELKVTATGRGADAVHNEGGGGDRDSGHGGKHQVDKASEPERAEHE